MVMSEMISLHLNPLHTPSLINQSPHLTYSKSQFLQIINKNNMAKMDWYTPLSKKFMERGYFSKDEDTVEKRIKSIANLVGKTFNDDTLRDKVKEYIEEGYYVLPTPVWSNVGTGRGSGISCFNSHVGDSIEEIIEANAEVGMLCKIGGGTSGYLGALRPEGSLISSGGESHGPMSFLELFNVTKQVISQGSTRRGEFAAYMDVSHQDIKKFLKINSEGNKFQRLPFGVCVTDSWIHEMKRGDLDKQIIWAEVLERRSKTGFPYILFTDTVNNNTVDVYKDKNMKIRSSNMCVAGNQLVTTSEGLITAYELYKQEKELILFDGEKAVKASKMKLIEKDVPLYKITTSLGRTHTITADHKIKVKTGIQDPDNKTYEYSWIECQDLKVGDELPLVLHEGMFGTKHNPEMAFLLGIYQREGTGASGEDIKICLLEDDYELCDEVRKEVDAIRKKSKLKKHTNKKHQTPNKDKPQLPPELSVEYIDLNETIKQFGFEKQVVPDWIFRSNKKTQSRYLRGLFVNNNNVYISEDISSEYPICLRLTNEHKEYLEQIQILLSNLGINAKTHLTSNADNPSLHGGKGSSECYHYDNLYCLTITNKAGILLFEKLTGFISYKRKHNIKNKDYKDNRDEHDEIISIEPLYNEDVYCCEVFSDDHAWVCNSFITHNCSEILLPSTDTESFVCNLIGMNLVKYDEWSKTDAVRVAVYIADAVLQEFIDTFENNNLIKRAIKFAKNHRAIALGASGYHSYLQSKMIPFESIQANAMNIQMFKLIQAQAWAASEEMAIKYGKPELLKEDKYKRRHTTLTAVAPNTSSSFVVGQQSQSIEPYVSNYYIKKSAKVKHAVKNPYLKELLASKDQDTFQVWESILKNEGSVQHLNFLSEEEKLVFKTFIEISQLEIVKQASSRQKYIDQSQSLNLMIHPSIPTKEVNQLILTAHEMGVKTLYYQLGQNAAQQFAKSLMSCVSCEG